MKRSRSPECSDKPVIKKNHSEPIVWPAPEDKIDAARAFIRKVAEAQARVVICPDKDADGLSAGVILYRTLVALGMKEDQLKVHLLSKGTSLRSESEADQIQKLEPSFVIVLDQGSFDGPEIVPGIPTLIIDHHYSFEFPDKAIVCTAAYSPPIATSALLTYHICEALHPDLKTKIDYLGVIGTVGDLSATVKWVEPFPPYLGEVMRDKGKKNVSDAVGLLNAPRRSSIYNTIEAWNSLLYTNNPSEILHHSTNPHLKKLLEARDEVAVETENNSHNAPLFSADKRTACLIISSGCQVHPVVATRWAGFLKSKDLAIVMCANTGYHPGKVHFSCRIPKFRRVDDGTDKAIDIQAILKDYASRNPDLERRLKAGGNFAKGHKEASGGVLETELWEELYKTMEIGKPVKKVKASPKKQSNVLTNYFTSPAKQKPPTRATNGSNTKMS